MMRFTIRDLLWLTVVVALGVAWWVDRRAMNRTQAHRDAEVRYLRKQLSDALDSLNVYRGGISVSDDSGPVPLPNVSAPGQKLLTE